MTTDSATADRSVSDALESIANLGALQRRYIDRISGNRELHYCQADRPVSRPFTTTSDPGPYPALKNIDSGGSD